MTKDRTEWEELACRVEGLTGPCRETDALIAIAVDAMGEYGEKSAREIMAGSPKNTVADLAKYWPRLRRYTASLDAALALVPEGWELALYGATDGCKPQAQLETPEMRADWRNPIDGEASSLALALTAAALRARNTENSHDR